MRKYGLLGKRLDYSFSKSFFEKYFRQNSIDATFDNFELEHIEQLPALFARDLSGLTVTIPYKQAVIPYLDELSSEAQEIGAVNVIQIKDGKFIGHNTDAYGFHQSIKPFLTNKHERALILGTGGAAKAVAHVFNAIGINVIYCSRNPIRSDEFGYDKLNQLMIKACKVIVNCTPVGTYPDINESIALPFEALTHEHLVIDLIYNPSKTKLLIESEKFGATILNGEGMLKAQALKAYELWTT